jgi:O-antigen ligase
VSKVVADHPPFSPQECKAEQMQSRSYRSYPPVARSAAGQDFADTRPIPSTLAWPVALAVGSSFYVAIEPAPTDLLFLLLLPVVVFKRGIGFPLDLNPILTIGLLAFFAFSALSILGSQDFGRSTFYFAITAYLLVSWYIVVTLLANYGAPMWELIIRAFLVAAVLAALVGLVSHFSTVVQDNLGLQPSYGAERTRGTFKDPNVYGPFLCAALLLVINHMVTRRFLSITLLSLLCLFAVEVLATFSRGAFVSLGVSLFFYFGLLVCVRPRRDWLARSLVIFVAGSLLVGAASVAFLRASSLEDFLFTRLQLQDYDDHRFSSQSLAIATVAEAPFGIGPGQSETFFPHATHNLYVRITVENGLLSMLFWLLFLGATAWIGLRGARRPGLFQDVYVCCLAILAGILVNSLVIDSLHWRHLYLFLAIPIGLARYERWRARSGVPVPVAATRS